MSDGTPAASAGLLAGSWALLLSVGYLVGRIVTDASWSWDAEAVHRLRGASGQPLLGLMRAVTQLGSPIVLDVVFALALATLLVAGRRRDAVFLIVASPGSVLLELVLKHAINRPRPAGLHLTAAHGPSWPSGHASSSLALYGALLVIALGGRLPIGRVAGRGVGRIAVVVVVVVVAVAAIGISRVYLGVHYPTDVVAGWVLAGSWVMISIRILQLVGPAPAPSGPGARAPADG